MGWGGVGWDGNVHSHFHTYVMLLPVLLHLPHIRDATLLPVLLHLPHIRDATLGVGCGGVGW